MDKKIEVPINNLVSLVKTHLKNLEKIQRDASVQLEKERQEKILSISEERNKKKLISKLSNKELRMEMLIDTTVDLLSDSSNFNIQHLTKEELCDNSDNYEQLNSVEPETADKVVKLVVDFIDAVKGL